MHINRASYINGRIFCSTEIGPYHLLKFLSTLSTLPCNMMSALANLPRPLATIFRLATLRESEGKPTAISGFRQIECDYKNGRVLLPTSAMAVRSHSQALLGALLLLLLLTGYGQASHTRNVTRPPNILFLFNDDQDIELGSLNYLDSVTERIQPRGIIPVSVCAVLGRGSAELTRFHQPSPSTTTMRPLRSAALRESRS